MLFHVSSKVWSDESNLYKKKVNKLQKKDDNIHKSEALKQ